MRNEWIQVYKAAEAELTECGPDWKPEDADWDATLNIIDNLKDAATRISTLEDCISRATTLMVAEALEINNTEN